MIYVYTDGSAVSSGCNKGKGGVGCVFIVRKRIIKVVSKGFYNTKTGRMELIAALIALTSIRKDQKVTILSDSMYVVKSFKERWIYRWSRTNFSTCKNGDLMKLLFREYSMFETKPIFKHVKGHSGDVYNDLADKLASYKNFKNFHRDE